MSTGAISHVSLTFFFRHMRPLIEAGYLYIAQPLFRAKRGQSEVYLKDQHELDGYLMEAGLKDAVLTLSDGTQAAGAELQDYAGRATMAGRLVDQLAGGLLPRRGRTGRHCRAAHRCHARQRRSRHLSGKTSRGPGGRAREGWKADVEDGRMPALVISRQLRGITERHVIDRRLLNAPEAVELDAMGHLQSIYERPASLRLGSNEIAISGPMGLSQAIFQTGRKGCTSRYKGLGEMIPNSSGDNVDPTQRQLPQVSIEQEEDADNASRR